MTRTLLFVCVATTLACSKKDGQAPASAQETAAAAAQKGRLIILGFDGVDPGRVQNLIDQGRLPNIKAIGEAGYRGPLQTTNPPLSPVAWSAFATGMGAGRHGIFDFIGRNVRNYFPKIATGKVRHASVQGGRVNPPEVENLRAGLSFWDVIAQGQVPVRTLHVPYAYPPPERGAKSMGGLGLPDVRGINSSFTLVTTEVAKTQGKPPAGGQVALLKELNPTSWQAAIKGPRIKVEGAAVTPEVTMTVRKVAKGMSVELGEHQVTLVPGRTGRYVEVTFQPSPALTIVGATRVTMLTESPLAFYVEPISNVPKAPYLPVSSPPELAQRLWDKHGEFKTVGWVHDTSALGEGAMTEAQFVAEAMQTMDRRRAMTIDAVKEATDKVLISVFTAPDRIGHMLYRYMDEKHAAPQPGNAADLAQAMDRSYDRMDQIIGEVSQSLAANDVLLVMSDHGFGSFRRGFNINTWLMQEGYIVLKPGVSKPRDYLQDVDWSKTRAYAYGTGGIFLNLQGREGQGIVAAADAPGLAAEIIAKIKKVKDGKATPVVNAYLGDELYPGPLRREAPDIRVALARGYRASWATTLAGIPAGLFQDNIKKWSGDHASADPADVPGILVSSVKIASEKPRIEDLAATAYAFTGVRAPEGGIGSNLLSQ